MLNWYRLVGEFIDKRFRPIAIKINLLLFFRTNNEVPRFLIRILIFRAFTKKNGDPYNRSRRLFFLQPHILTK